MMGWALWDGWYCHGDFWSLFSSYDDVSADFRVVFRIKLVSLRYYPLPRPNCQCPVNQRLSLSSQQASTSGVLSKIGAQTSHDCKSLRS